MLLQKHSTTKKLEESGVKTTDPINVVRAACESTNCILYLSFIVVPTVLEHRGSVYPETIIREGRDKYIP